MTDEQQLRLVRLAGLGLAIGGLVLGILSQFVPEVLLAGALLLAAVVIQFEKPPGSDLLNLGLTLGVFGALLFAQAAADLGPFDALSIAIVLVLAGLFEIVAARRLIRLRSARQAD